MARRSPSRVRYDAPARPFARPVPTLPGLSPRGLAAIVRLERDRFWPGAARQALDAWEVFLRDPTTACSTRPMAVGFPRAARIRSSCGRSSQRSSTRCPTRTPADCGPGWPTSTNSGSRSSVPHQQYPSPTANNHLGRNTKRPASVTARWHARPEAEFSGGAARPETTVSPELPVGPALVMFRGRLERRASPGR